ncbi:MAG: Fur family transcriptional regulator [Dehalococcoidia bacterium]
MPHEHHRSTMAPLDTDEAIRRTGLRRTVPRAVVARVLQANSGHLSVGEIQELIDRDHGEAAGIARSSVYRALEALEGAGLIVAVRAGQEEVRFEWAEQSHHHLICDQCGHVSQVELNAAPALEREVSRTYGFKTRIRHLALRGTCRSCTGARG